MSIKVNWDDNDQLAIRYDFNGVWDWVEFAWANTRAFDMIYTVSHEVSIILNMKNSIDVPVGALSAIQQMLSMSPHNMGVVIVVNCDRQTGYTFNMLNEFDPGLSKYLTLEKTLEDARQKLWRYWTVMVG